MYVPPAYVLRNFAFCMHGIFMPSLWLWLKTLIFFSHKQHWKWIVVCLLRERNGLFLYYVLKSSVSEPWSVPLHCTCRSPLELPDRQLGCGWTYVTKQFGYPQSTLWSWNELLETSRGHMAWSTTPGLREATVHVVTVISIVEIGGSSGDRFGDYWLHTQGH